MVLAKFIEDINFIKYCISGVILYAAAMSIFLGVYHFQKPSKMLIATVEEEYQKMLEEEAKENSETEAKENSEEQK